MAETIELLKSERVEVLSLDHDLGEDELTGTGYDVLRWLEEKVVMEGFTPPADIRTHTANSAAKPKMEAAIERINQYAEGNR